MAAAAFADFDFEAGAALLNEYIADPDRSDGKSVGDPIDVELSCPPDPTLIAYMQVIDAVWSGSGLVNVDLTQFDQATHINKAIEDDFGAHCWRMGSDADPALGIPAWVGPPTEEVAAEFGYGPEVVQPNNFTNYFNPDAFEAVRAASQTADFGERYALYEEAMTILAQEAAFWYSGHTAFMIATADNVYGLAGWTLPEGQLGIGILPDANIRLAEAFISG